MKKILSSLEDFSAAQALAGDFVVKSALLLASHLQVSHNAVNLLIFPVMGIAALKSMRVFRSCLFFLQLIIDSLGFFRRAFVFTDFLNRSAKTWSLNTRHFCPARPGAENSRFGMSKTKLTIRILLLLAPKMVSCSARTAQWIAAWKLGFHHESVF